MNQNDRIVGLIDNTSILPVSDFVLAGNGGRKLNQRAVEKSLISAISHYPWSKHTMSSRLYSVEHKTWEGMVRGAERYRLASTVNTYMYFSLINFREQAAVQHENELTHQWVSLHNWPMKKGNHKRSCNNVTWREQSSPSVCEVVGHWWGEPTHIYIYIYIYI